MSVKITHVLYAGLGGHFNVLKNLVESDSTNFFKVSVIFYGIELPRNEYLDFCKSLDIPNSYVKKTRGLDFSFIRRLTNEMISFKPEILFLHSSYPILSGLAAKKQILNLQVIIRETQAIHLKSKKEIRYTKLGLLHADKVVFLSKEYASKTLTDNNELNPNHKTAIIPNGIEIPSQNKDLIKKSSQLTIGMLSRIVKIKDHETLLRSILQIKNKRINLNLKIAGDGENLDALKKLTKELNLTNEVEFLGMIDPSQINTFLNNLNIYVHASFGETMSNSIMQAQACGLPIIASDVDGINNVITNGSNGILVETQNVDSLTNAIELVYTNSKLRNKLSEASFNYANNFLSRDRMFNSYKELCS